MSFFTVQINSIIANDPSIKSRKEAVFHPSFKAMSYYKISHYLYQHKHYILARIISNHAKKVTGIEIHPGAILEDDLFIDHGSGVVIGETSIVGHGVILFHGVTLGGTGSESGKRHPTIEDNVLVGCGAKVLGNICVKKNAKIGANAVVIRDVDSNSTAVGVPARCVKKED